jgi:hypothetical protein
MNQLVAQQQAQFAAWLAFQEQAGATATPPATEAAAVVQPAAVESVIAEPAAPNPGPAEPVSVETTPVATAENDKLDSENAAPTASLADALPSWPSDDMVYSDVHGALFGDEPTSLPPTTAMAMAEVDLQAIDSILDEVEAPTFDGPMRYAPFLMRALCIAARTVDSNDVNVHIDVVGAVGATRRVEDAHDKHLSALTRELADDPTTTDTPATVVVHVSSSQGGHLRVEIGDGTVPTISLVHLHKRPIATRDRLGSTAITTHSMGLLSVAASSTPVRADEYLQMLREILETRDWTTELD